MVTAASWLAWPGFEAFFVKAPSGPDYLIQVDRGVLARGLARGCSLERIVAGQFK